MGMYLDTPFRYVPVHLPPCRACTMYLFAVSRIERATTKSIHHHTPPIHPNTIPSHPSMPCLGQCDLPRQRWMLAIKHAKHLMKRDEEHRSFSLLCGLVCLSVLSVRSQAERARTRTSAISLPLSKHQQHLASNFRTMLECRLLPAGLC